MASTIYLVRHGESEHNVSKETSQLDPPLTTLGYSQASQLISKFPNPERIAVILTSPLRRAIQTSLASFPHVLDKRYFEPSSDLGVDDGIELILEPDLQERSAFPCDTGSERHILAREFPNLTVEALSEGWQTKAGQYAADDDSVTSRAERTREKLKHLDANFRDKERRDIVVVTHGVFMKFLSGEEDIDLPKAGWKAYTISNNDKDTAVLVPLNQV